MRLRAKINENLSTYISVTLTADVVGDFTLELKKMNEELMIVRAARAKLSAKDKKISLQGMNEAGPMQIILNYSKYMTILNNVHPLREGKR